MREFFQDHGEKYGVNPYAAVYMWEILCRTFAQRKELTEEDKQHYLWFAAQVGALRLLADAMQYWVECGIVLADGKAPEIQAEPEYAAPAKASTPVEITAEIGFVRPTAEQILKRTKESAEIQFMFNEAQKKLGRTIGYDGQSTLLMIHDSYGLPVEVLLMLIEYCVSIGKNSIAYISKAAKTWSEKEIKKKKKADD